MKVVNLYDLKQMGNKGGCTIQLIHHFPFGMGLGHLKKDYIEFKRVGIIDGKAVEVTLREPYSRDLLQVVKSIKQRQKLIAYRYKEGKLLFVKKEASDVPLNNRNEWQFNMLSVVFIYCQKSLKDSRMV